MTHRRWALIALVLAALAGLLTVGTWASVRRLSGPAGAPSGFGIVGDKYGPAMMSRYGMHAGAPAQVSAADATQLAQRWLDDQRPRLTAGESEQFPGHYTLHTL
ncbi:MAG: hypothetical protein ACRDTH_25575 [Pseudonocardiaceae bacterium]